MHASLHIWLHLPYVPDSGQQLWESREQEGIRDLLWHALVPDQTKWLRIYDGERWLGILSGWLDLEGILIEKDIHSGAGKQDNQLDIHEMFNKKLGMKEDGETWNKGFGIQRLSKCSP